MKDILYFVFRKVICPALVIFLLFRVGQIFGFLVFMLISMIVLFLS